MSSISKSDWAKIIAFVMAILPLVAQFFFRNEAKND